MLVAILVEEKGSRRAPNARLRNLMCYVAGGKRFEDPLPFKGERILSTWQDKDIVVRFLKIRGAEF